MSERGANRHGRRGRSRGPIPGIAIALAIVFTGSAGGFVLASYATGDERGDANAVPNGYSRAFDDLTAGYRTAFDGEQSTNGPDDYRCQGCGPGLAARMAAQYDAGYYDSAAYDYVVQTPDAFGDPPHEGERSGAAPPPYRPLPFSDAPEPSITAPAPASAVSRRTEPPVVRPVPVPAMPRSLSPTPTDRTSVAPGDRLPAAAPSEDQPAGSQPEQKQG